MGSGRSWHWDTTSSTSTQNTSPNIVRWYPSPKGVLKLNFDTFVLVNGTAVAFVIQEYTGQLIRAGG